MAMIERRSSAELRAIAKRAEALMWAQCEANDRHGDAADQSDGEEAAALLSPLSPAEHDAVMKMLRMWACNA